ncbi:UNVERIFIED_CONTAM: hypothetical protein HDU68_010439 [Siphonaria sp. JEL0065]|nr:hypothetical protein HDU68_010439 [Siphonaria sp. JEL0065]
MQGDSVHVTVTSQETLSAPSKTPGKSFSTASIASTQTIQTDLSALAQELAAFKRHGNPPFVDVQSFAERIWRANLSYETAIAKLEREKKMLTQQIDTIWGSFDTLIRPLWRVDDAVVPIYDTLADIRIRLEDIYSQKLDALASTNTTSDDSELFQEELVEAQRRLHQLEEKHVVDGKFVPENWKAGDRVPSGQAVVANLLAKCYRLVRMINEADPVVDKQLIPIQLRLENVIRSLKTFKAALFAKVPVEPLELTSLQLHVDAIANLQKDGSFVSESDPTVIPQGQAVLHEMLEEAYDLIHDSLVELENRDSKQEKSSEVEQLIGRVTGVLESFNVSNVKNVNQEREAIAATTASEKDLLASTPALHTLGETLSEGYKYLRQGGQKVEDVVDTGASSLASLVRSGLSSVGKAFGLIETVDPTLIPTYDRLVHLKSALITLRNERDKAVAEKIRNGGEVVLFEGEKFERQEYSIRTHLVVLEEIDMDRDEEGRFTNEEGGAPQNGQAQLKAILEECFILAYELL